MGEMKLIAVPTAFSIYRVHDDVIQMHKAEFMSFPMPVVMEILVMQGLAKLVARQKPFDMEEVGDDEAIELPEAYVMGDSEPPAPDNPGEEELPGPWYRKEESGDDDGA